MRRGRLLAENSPEELLVEHNLETLEEVFLKLCMSDSSHRAAAMAGGGNWHAALAANLAQEISKGNSNLVTSDTSKVTCSNNNNKLASSKFNSSYSLYSADSVNVTNNVSTVNLVPSSKIENRFKQIAVPGESKSSAKKRNKSLTLSEYWQTTTALFWKNCTRLRRNIPVLLFQFALPAIQVILFCICIGADPFNIPVAIVNEEDPPFLSKMFLDKLDPYLVHQVSESVTGVKCHSALGHLFFSPYFSTHLLFLLFFYHLLSFFASLSLYFLLADSL